MKKLLILLLFSVQFCYAQEEDCISFWTLVRQADSMFKTKNYQQANETFSRALEYEKCIQPYILYNAACAAARAEEVETAFSRLLRYAQIRKEWYSETLPEEEDFLSLHGDPRWQVLLDTLAQRQLCIEKNYNKPLRAQLKKIMDRDQKLRFAYLDACKTVPRDTGLINSIVRQVVKADSMNREEVFRIIDTYGWVGKDQVGDVCTAIWLVIQHSSLEIQKKYLYVIKEGVDKGDLSRSKLALLEDRINLREGRPQKYGSQLRRRADGSHYVAPLLDTLRVDEWRKEAGMIPLGEYTKIWGFEWKPNKPE